jgi:hypothetical protein
VFAERVLVELRLPHGTECRFRTSLHHPHPQAHPPNKSMCSEANPTVEQHAGLRVAGIDVETKLDGTWANPILRWCNALNVTADFNLMGENAAHPHSVASTRGKIGQRQNDRKVPFTRERRCAGDIPHHIDRLKSD